MYTPSGRAFTSLRLLVLITDAIQPIALFVFAISQFAGEKSTRLHDQLSVHRRGIAQPRALGTKHV